jgi:hypothetical protein
MTHKSQHAAQAPALRVTQIQNYKLLAFPFIHQKSEDQLVWVIGY